MIRSKLHGPALAGYEDSKSPYYAAAGPGLDPGWLDAIIDPLETRIPPRRRDRLWISMGIEATFAKTLRRLKAASQCPATREFNMGVLQT